MRSKISSKRASPVAMSGDAKPGVSIAEHGGRARELHHPDGAAPREVRRSDTRRRAGIAERLLRGWRQIGRRDLGDAREHEQRGPAGEHRDGAAAQPSARARPHQRVASAPAVRVRSTRATMRAPLGASWISIRRASASGRSSA